MKAIDKQVSKNYFSCHFAKIFCRDFWEIFFKSVIFEKNLKISQKSKNSRSWIFLRKSLLDTVPHDDVTCLLVVVTMSPISVNKVIWSDLRKLACVMFIKFFKKKCKILRVKFFFKIIPKNNHLSTKIWPFGDRFFRRDGVFGPLNPDEFGRGVTFLNLVIQHLYLTLLFLSFLNYTIKYFDFEVQRLYSSVKSSTGLVQGMTHPQIVVL